MSRTPAAVLLGLLVLLAGPLQAQQTSATAPASGGGDEPIEINSDRLVLEQNQQVATFTGNVDAVQGVTRLQSDKMRVFYANNPVQPADGTKPAGGSKQSVNRIEAEGNVVITKPGETAQGRTGTYDLVTRKLVLLGDVVLTRGQNVVRGDRLDSDLATSVSTVTVNKPAAGTGKTKSRVKALFVPEPAPKAP